MIARPDFTAPSAIPPRAALLVIGYGNALRSDDGAGIRAAAMIAARDSLARVITCQQLTPELVDDIAAASQVVFIDAYAANEEGSRLRIERVGTDELDGGLGHRADPARLLALAGRLHGHFPDAWVVGVPAYCFDAGEVISSETARRVDDAVALFGE